MPLEGKEVWTPKHLHTAYNEGEYYFTDRSVVITTYKDTIVYRMRLLSGLILEYHYSKLDTKGWRLHCEFQCPLTSLALSDARTVLTLEKNGGVSTLSWLELTEAENGYVLMINNEEIIVPAGTLTYDVTGYTGYASVAGIDADGKHTTLSDYVYLESPTGSSGGGTVPPSPTNYYTDINNDIFTDGNGDRFTHNY